MEDIRKMTSDEIAGRLADLYDENQIKTQITAFMLGEEINFLFSGSNKDMLNVSIQIVERLILMCVDDFTKDGMDSDTAFIITKHLVRGMVANMLAQVRETWKEEQVVQDAVNDAEAEMNKGMESGENG